MPITTTGRATDFITFTRTSNATVTDRDGKIKWAGHNLLTNSESFDASAWSRSGISAVTANSTAAPNGTTTADTVVEDTSASANHFVAQTPTIAAAQAITYGVWVKRGSGTRNIAITIIASGGSDYISQVYDLGAGTLGSSTAVGTGVITDKTISSAGSGWYYITLTGTPSTTAAVTGGACRLALTNGTTFGSQTYTGDGTSSIILWGAHLYRSDLGGMVLNPARGDAYYPTTPRNLLGYTEDFSNAAWDKSSFGTSATSNTLIAPNGLQTADLITAINSTNNHLVYQSSGINLAASGVVTGSIYVKADTATFVRFGVVDNASGADWAGFIVNLSTGAVTNTYTGANASNVTTHTPVSVGNGWYRVGITATLTASTNDLTLRVGPFNAASASPGNYFSVSWAAAGTESIYLWGAQLSDSASLDAYSPVYGAAVTSAAYYAPRLDFDANGSALGLLVEEQRTNLAWHSADYTQLYWTKVNASIDATAVVAPDGVSRTTLRVKDDATNASHAIRRSFSTTNGLTYTLSFWVKKGTTDTFAAVVYADGVYFATLSVSSIDNNTQSVTGATGVNPTASRVSYPSGWYRYSFTFTATSASAPDINFHPRNLTGAYVGTGDYTDFYGIQLEQGSFATSYIPTGASTATRTADVASVSTQAFPYSSTAGTVVANFNTISTQSTLSRVVWQLTESVNNRILVMYNPNSVLLRHLAFVGGSAVGIVDYNVTPPTKDAFAYKADDFAGSANGASVTSDPSGAVPTPATQLAIGRNDVSSSDYLNGWIRQITYIPRRLSNAELQSRSV